MSQDVLREAIKKLEKDLKALVSEMKKKQQAINVLYETLGEPTRYHMEEDSKVIRGDQFYSKPFATAASEFLKLKEHACTAEEILHGLEEGGFDFPWPQKDRLRSVAVSLGKNSITFHKLPNGSYGLVEWYPDAQMKRTRFSKPKSVEALIEGFDKKEKEHDIEDLTKE